MTPAQHIQASLNAMHAKRSKTPYLTAKGRHTLWCAIGTIAGIAIALTAYLV